MARKRGITQATMSAAAKAEKEAARIASTSDSFQNLAINLGLGTNNASTASTYGFNPITRNRTLLEFCYRGSWIVGQVIDCVAEDMTKKGVDFTGENEPDDLEDL